MSSNPTKAPTNGISELDHAPIFSLRFAENFSERYAEYKKDQSLLQEKFKKLDWEPLNSVLIKRNNSTEKYYREAAKEKLANTLNYPVQARPYTKYGRQSMVLGYESLPISGASFANQPEVADRIRETGMFRGGTAMAMGRVLTAYPKRGAWVDAPTSKEVARAVRSAGLDHGKVPKMYPLNPHVSEEDQLKINMHSDNGFPVGGYMSDPEAAQMVMGFAQFLYDRLRPVAHDAALFGATISALEETMPDVFLFKGKTKEDYYKGKKIQDFCMRFYNVVPRQLMLLMQMATQPFEAVAQNVLDDSELHSAQGVSLAHGGAEALVEAMEEQLYRDGQAFVHVGDDSWIVIQQGTKMVAFALDCSNFDLTQHADVKNPVIDALMEKLMPISSVGARVWARYMKERATLVSGTQVFKVRHGGPSGMPCQSKVNDVLMDIFIRRLLDREMDWTIALDVAQAVEKVGATLGFSVRLEQYAIVNATTLRGMLRQKPFLFIGYYMWADEEGRVFPYVDVARSLAQRPYPAMKWLKDDGELLMREAMRLGSLAMSQGIPPPEHRASAQVQLRYVMELLKDALSKHGDVENPRLVWAVRIDVSGPEAIPSLGGLLRALERGPDALWLPKEEILLNKMLEQSAMASLSWADLVADEELREGEYQPPPSSLTPIRTVVPAKVKPAVKVTLKNFGKMPARVKDAPPPVAQRAERSAVTASQPKARKGGRGKRQVTLLDTEDN